MHRREFVGACAGALAAGGFPSISTPAKDFSGKKAPFPVSVMLWTIYRNLPFEARLEKVAAAGYAAIELVDEFKGWSGPDFVTAARRLHQLGIQVDATAGVWHTLADANDRDAFLHSVRAFISIMRSLDCSRLILQTGNVVPSLSREQMRANCIETLKRGGDLAAESKIELLIENIDPEENPNYFLTSSAEGFEIIKSVGNPNVKFLYDFYHEQIAEGNLIEKLAKNIEMLGLVHVADVPGRHEPGTGEINYENIYRKLGELNYNRFLAMEFLPTGDPVTSLRTARETAWKCGSEGNLLPSVGSGFYPDDAAA